MAADTNRRFDPRVPRLVPSPVNPAPAPPTGGAFQPLANAASIPNSYFFNNRIAGTVPTGSGMGRVATGPGSYQGNTGGGAFDSLGRAVPSNSDLIKGSVFAGLTNSDTIKAITNAATGNGTWSQAGYSALGNVGDSLANNYIDRATGQPISQYAGIANLIAQGVAPGSTFASLTQALSHPVSTAVNYATGAGTNAATSAGASAGTSAAAGSTTGLTAGAATNAGEGTFGTGNALGAAAATYGLYQGVKGVGAAYRAGDVKNGMIAGAGAGAAVGSYVAPVIGTAVGGIIGGGLGALYVGASNVTNESNTQQRAWSQFVKAPEDATFRGSAFPISAALDGAMRSSNDRDPALLAAIGDQRGSGFNTSMYARSWLQNQISAAQAAGKLPADGQLSSIDGRRFFEQELAPQIWGSGAPKNDNIKRIMGEMTDNIFAYGVGAPTGGSGPAYRSDGTFDEAASRGQH